MKLSIFGLGYVGAVITACFSRNGHHIVGVDIDETKVSLMQSGKPPIIEEGLAALISEGVRNGSIRATRAVAEAVADTDISMICVGTPSLSSGALDLTFVRRVCEQIGEALREKAGYHLIVVRSTMLPGSVEGTVIPAIEGASGKRRGEDFGVAINPEFLREGSAIHDFDHPPKTVIGAQSERDAEWVADLYRHLDAPLIKTSIRTAEMVKYTDNVFHALKVSFANEIGTLCKQLGVNGREVMEIFCEDRKLNLSPAYLRPGFAYGGSCLPKDLRAISRLAQTEDVAIPIIASIAVSNEAQIRHAVRRVAASGCRRIGVLGFAFKGGTDDLRESPVITLVETLLGKGFEIKLCDPCVSLSRLVGANRRYIEQHIPHISRLMVDSPDEIAAFGELVILGNQNPAFPPVLARMAAGQRILDLTPAFTPPVTVAAYEHIAS